MFYLALVALLLGTQLFLTGFIAELIARQSISKKEYLVIEDVGMEINWFKAPHLTVRQEG